MNENQETDLDLSFIVEVCIEDTGIPGERWAVKDVESGRELARFRNQHKALEWAQENNLKVV